MSGVWSVVLAFTVCSWHAKQKTQLPAAPIGGAAGLLVGYGVLLITP